MSVLWALLGFVVAMGLLVAIHEWGHFVVAKLFNIKVQQFSIGFGKPIWKKRVGETEYRLGLLPLGGYVKFIDEREGPVSDEDLPRAFNRQSVYKRFAVVSAGPLINLVFAWWLFAALYWFGVPGLKPVFEAVPDSPLAMQLKAVETLSSSVVVQDKDNQAWQILKIKNQAVSTWRQVHHTLVNALIDQEKTVTLTVVAVDSSLAVDPSKIQFVTASISQLNLELSKQNWLAEMGMTPAGPKLPTVLGEVVAGSPADKAGFKTGDEILSVDGEPVGQWQLFVDWVRKHPGETVNVSFKRDQAIFTQAVTLESQTNGNQEIGRFGAALMLDKRVWAPYKTTVHFPLMESLQKGWEHSLELVDMSLIMLKRMLFGEASIKNLSGPITIADVSGQALQSGLVSFISLLGLLSLSLGILNLLPIPMLDGGHLMFYLIEMVRGAPLSESLEGLAQRVGLMIILSLTFIALFNDVVRITDG